MVIKCPQCQSRYHTDDSELKEKIQCRCGVEILIPALKNLPKSWKCPNCGGATTPKDSRCNYCDAYLAFACCPSCFSIASYHDAKHCSECGERLTLPIKPIHKNKKGSSCPRCSSVLQGKVVDAYWVELCRDCGGVWLSHQLLDELLKNETLNSFSVLGKRPSNNKNLTNHAVKYLPCPECNTHMSRHNFMLKSNIILDQCHQHGVWFDKYELAVALDFWRSSSGLSNANQEVPNQRHSNQSSNRNSNRTDYEIFEIKEEDISVLLEEFPHWLRGEEKDR